MLSFYCTLILLMLVNSSHGQTNYCSLGRDHTMCAYLPAACPLGLLARGVTEADKATILKIHNDLRKRVATGQESGQPSAANIKEMIWDDELATIAQRWADQCTFGHDANRRTATYSWVGQNAATTSSSSNSNSAADFTSATLMWYDEVNNPGFSPNNISPFVFNSGSGHYTQVVWAASPHIGCGYTYYNDGSWYTKLYYCNYGPGGNVAGGEMYKVGAAGSACVGGVSTAYQGLCVP